MNEKLKELKKEAFRQTEWEELDYDRILEKFAELIVQECADLFPLTFTDEHYQRRIDKTIRKHFGLEQ
jgi:hypothetical protein